MGAHYFGSSCEIRLMKTIGLLDNNLDLKYKVQLSHVTKPNMKTNYLELDPTYIRVY